MKRLTLLLALTLPACSPQPAEVAPASAVAPAVPPAIALPAVPSAIHTELPPRAIASAETQATGSATTAAATPQATPAAPALPPRRIGATALKAALDAGDAIVVDVRGDLAWQLARVDGSISIPLGDLFRRSVELPAEKLIAFYCTCPAEESSGHAAEELARIGFERTAALVGGMDAWRAAGFPIAGEGIAK